MQDRTFTEQDFFLDLFAGTTIGLVIPLTCPPQGSAELLATITTLLRRGVRLILLARGQPATLPPLPAGVTVTLNGELSSDLAGMWHPGKPLVIATLEAGKRRFLLHAARLAAAMRLNRLLFLHPSGGVAHHQGGVASFLSYRKLRHLARADSPLLTAIARACGDGVAAVSLCRAEELGRELFSYEGAGTFFSRDSYCRVRRLRWDDFPSARELLARGEAEGFLLARPPTQLLDVLLNGFGVFINPGKLAGMASLRHYPEHRTAEVVALYTLTRYQGNGLGSLLLRRILRAAKRSGLHSLFACTTHQVVAEFFQNHGFIITEPEKLPPEKWHAYDQTRLARLICLRHET